jgi:hypothetical protein
MTYEPWYLDNSILVGVLCSSRELLVMDDLSDISNAVGQKIDGILGEDVLKEFAKLEIAELVSKGLPDVRQPTVCCRGAEGLVIDSQKSQKPGQQIQQFASPEETPF